MEVVFHDLILGILLHAATARAMRYVSQLASPTSAGNGGAAKGLGVAAVPSSVGLPLQSHRLAATRVNFSHDAGA
ncbi:unnamed protein product [Urochloa humidicola]